MTTPRAAGTTRYGAGRLASHSPPTMPDPSQILARLMDERAWTQAEAARALGIDQGRVSKILSGTIAISEPIRRLCLCYLRYSGLRPRHLLPARER